MRLRIVLVALTLFAVWNVVHQSYAVIETSNDERASSPSSSIEERPTAPPRIYCVVPSLYAESKLKIWDAILDTWGPRCDTLKFFIDATPDAPFLYKRRKYVVEIVHVPMVRENKNNICKDGKPCKHIWEKMWRSWVHVVDSDPDFRRNDFFVKVDDDSYFFPFFLKAYLRENNVKSTDEVYLGHWIGQMGDGPYDAFVAGASVVLSKKTLQLLVPVLKNMPHEYGARSNFKSHDQCVDRDGATEELVTRRCLERVGIAAQPMRTADRRGGFRTRTTSARITHTRALGIQSTYCCITRRAC